MSDLDDPPHCKDCGRKINLRGGAWVMHRNDGKQCFVCFNLELANAPMGPQ